MPHIAYLQNIKQTIHQKIDSHSTEESLYQRFLETLSEMIDEKIKEAQQAEDNNSLSFELNGFWTQGSVQILLDRTEAWETLSFHQKMLVFKQLITEARELALDDLVELLCENLLVEYKNNYLTQHSTNLITQEEKATFHFFVETLKDSYLFDTEDALLANKMIASFTKINALYKHFYKENPDNIHVAYSLERLASGYTLQFKINPTPQNSEIAIAFNERAEASYKKIISVDGQMRIRTEPLFSTQGKSSSYNKDIFLRGLASILKRLGDLWQNVPSKQNKNLDESIACYQSALDFYRIVRPDDIPTLIQKAAQLAELCEKTKRNDLAISYYFYIISLHNQSEKPNVLAIGILYEKIGLLHNKNCEWKEMKHSLENALSHYEIYSAKNPNDMVMSRIHFYLGCVYRNIPEDMEKAIVSLNKSRMIHHHYKETQGHHHVKILSVLENLQYSYQELNQIPEAINVYKEYQKIYPEFLSSFLARQDAQALHDIANTLKEFADLCRKEKRLPDALAVYREVLDVENQIKQIPNAKSSDDLMTEATDAISRITKKLERRSAQTLHGNNTSAHFGTPPRNKLPDANSPKAVADITSFCGKIVSS